jgi:hypothetical protein
MTRSLAMMMMRFTISRVRDPVVPYQRDLERRGFGDVPRLFRDATASLPTRHRMPAERHRMPAERHRLPAEPHRR